MHALPKALKQKMQDYFQTVWSINHGIDPSQVGGACHAHLKTNLGKEACTPALQVLSDYPEELRGDVTLHLHKEVPYLI